MLIPPPPPQPLDPMMACPYQHYHVCTASRQTLLPPLQNPPSEPLSSTPTLLLPPPMILPIRKTVRFRLRIRIVFRIPLPALQPLLQKLQSRAKPSESSTPDQFHRSPLNKSATSQTPSTVPLPTPPTLPSAYQEPPPPMSKSHQRSTRTFDSSTKTCTPSSSPHRRTTAATPSANGSTTRRTTGRIAAMMLQASMTMSLHRETRRIPRRNGCAASIQVWDEN
jgi:hypothetical protein